MSSSALRSAFFSVVSVRANSRFLLLAALVALGLQIQAIHAHSLTGDGAVHLLAGHQALRYGYNTINLEHPPLAKLVMSIPAAWADQPLAPPLEPSQVIPTASLMFGRPDLQRAATIRGRYLAWLVFALPFLGASYLLGRRWSGPRTGALLALMLAFTPSVLAHLTILQTDIAVALGFVATILAAWTFMERPGARSAATLGACWGFALSVKFSGALLGPPVLAAVWIATSGDTGRWRRALRWAVVVILAATVVLHAAYALANTRYDRDRARTTIVAYMHGHAGLVADDRLGPYESMMLGIERIDPYAAQWLTGFVAIAVQNSLGAYLSYAFGTVSSEGRWWYHPVLLLLKVPLVILFACLGMLVSGLRHRSRSEDRSRATARRRQIAVVVGLTVGVYLGTAMWSNYNLGFRHLIPILPLLYLPVAAWLARRSRMALAVVAVLALESLAMAPYWLAATNTWWLGSYNPTRFALGGGNLEYGQSHVMLAKETRALGITDLRVAYAGMQEVVLRAHLADARIVDPEAPIVPGWYAVSAQLEQLVPALVHDLDSVIHDDWRRRTEAHQWAPFLERIAQAEDHGYVAAIYHLYRVRE